MRLETEVNARIRHGRSIVCAAVSLVPLSDYRLFLCGVIKGARRCDSLGANRHMKLHIVVH